MPQTEPTAERDRLLAAARVAYGEGRLAEAKSLCDKAIALDPNNASAKITGGVICARLGETQAAIALLQEAVSQDPTSFEALISLATIFRESHDYERAAEMGYRALQLRPQEAHAHYQFGVTWLAAQKFDRAIVALNRAAELQPNLPTAYSQLGKAWYLHGNHEESVKAFKKAVQLASRPQNFIGLSNSLNKLSDFAEAAAAARQALNLDPKSPAAHLALASALFGLDQSQEAERHLSQAQALDQSGAEALNIGRALRAAGKLDQANASFLRAIETDPRQPAAYSQFIHNTKITPSERRLVDDMEALVAGGRLSPNDEGALHYALGKAREDLGDYQSAMLHYDEANRLAVVTKLHDIAFDPEQLRRRVDAAIRALTPDVIRHGAPGRSDSELPILVFGMTRSGTTLAEQILSCHPRIQAVGDRRFGRRTGQGRFRQERTPSIWTG